MLIPVTSARAIEAAFICDWYWYALAMESLMLDRLAGSVTLKAPSTKFAREPALYLFAREGTK